MVQHTSRLSDWPLCTVGDADRGVCRSSTAVQPHAQTRPAGANEKSDTRRDAYSGKRRNDEKYNLLLSDCVYFRMSDEVRTLDVKLRL
jgi:hypothetical protein